MTPYERLQVELVYFEKKGVDGDKIVYPANFMFVKIGGTNRSFVMPVPMHMKLSLEPGKVQKSQWFEIVHIHFYDGRQGGGLPAGGIAVQSFGDV